MFAPWSVIFTIQQLSAIRNGKLSEALQEQVGRTMPAGDPAVQQMLAFFQSGPGLAVALGFALVVLFCFITGLSMAGGALGAKIGGRS
jgi:hypothetical protein